MVVARTRPAAAVRARDRRSCRSARARHRSEQISSAPQRRSARPTAGQSTTPQRALGSIAGGCPIRPAAVQLCA
eukprot:6996064-Prymnesium_polylepis.1